MYSRHQNLVYVSLILLCVVGAQFLYGERQDPNYTEMQDPNSVVAIVNGTEIFYRDIRIDPNIVQLGYTGDMNTFQLDAEVKKHETRRLTSKIRDVIFAQKVAEFGLTASEEEVGSRVEEIFQKTGTTPEIAKKVSEKARAMYEALAAWHKDPSKANAIYNEKLAGLGVSREGWKLNQLCWDTPEKLRRFVVPDSIDDMKRTSRESSRRDVLYKKLNDIITKDVSVSIEEIEAEYQKEYCHVSPKPPFDDVKESIRSELLSKKKQEAKATWWREQYGKSNIETFDEQFRDILDMLDPSKTSLSQ